MYKVPVGMCKEMGRCYIENKQQDNSAQYIQNRKNWCWAVACRMVGEQFKRNHPEFDFLISPCGDTAMGDEEGKGIRTDDRKGLRMDIVEWDGESFLVDSWQRAIVMNANTECPGFDGNFSGDDIAKERGLKYVVTGQCDSNLIQIANLGSFDSRESLLAHYQDQLYAVFQKGDYMIGNSILYPRGISHSFVLLNWTENNKVLIYDPWNGSYAFYPAEDVFYSGISVALGNGIIKWVQYIV